MPIQDIALPRRNTVPLGDCQTDATILAGMLEAVELMLNEDFGSDSRVWGNAILSVAMAARARAVKLADDLDRVQQ